MAVDNLTLRIQAELKKRGTVATPDQINRILQAKGINQATAKPSSPGQSPGDKLAALSRLRGPQIPGMEARHQQGAVGNTALNAVGAGLWSFADTAAFGIPGAFVTEEDYINYDDPWAKALGAFGGFAGFVYGAPLKVGAKLVQQAAKPFIKAAGKESVDTIVRGITKASKAGGVDKKVIREVTGGYKSLVKSAQINPALRGAEFETAATNYLNRFLDIAKAEERITAGQAGIIMEAFGKNFARRPLQDFIGVVAARGILKDSPRAMRVLGHSINDALMFGMIDTVFEGVSMIEDGHYDWTAPLWGVGTGALFGQLSWLNPRGKGSQWLPDFKAGLRASFAKDPYVGKSTKSLIAAARLMGESSKNHDGPLSAIKKFMWKGKEHSIDLLDDNIGALLKSKFGVDSDRVLTHILNIERKAWGKNIMKWANKESLQNMQENWFRMTAGGVLFNAHTFYDMYAHGYEADIMDILPHFLIGAYVQRHANPAKWDMGSTRINQARENLMLLGFSPTQLKNIPSFRFTDSRFKNPLTDKRYNSVVDVAKEMGIVSDAVEVTEERLQAGEISVQQQPNREFEIIYRRLEKHGTFLKPLDSISVDQAKRVVDELKRIDPSLKNWKDIEELFYDAVIEKTKDFEDSLASLVSIVNNADGNNELGIHIDPAKTSRSRVPAIIEISEDLLRKARNRELEWLEETDSPEVEIMDTIQGFLTVAKVLPLIDKARVDPSNENRVIKSEQLLKDIYEATKSAEKSIQSEYPDGSHMSDNFSFKHSASDYIDIVATNHVIRSADIVSKIFGKEYPDYDKLSGLMRRAGIVKQEGIEGRLIKDIRKVWITGTTKGTDEAAELKKFLGRVLTLSSISGTYKKVQSDPEKAKVKAKDVRALKEFLEERGYKEIKGFVHEAIADYMMRERIKNTNLQLWQTDALMRLSEWGFADLGLAVEGKAAGFSIKYLDNVVYPDSENANQSKKMVKEYNRAVDKIIEDGNGFVAADVQKLQLHNYNMLVEAHKVLVDFNYGDSLLSARGKLLEFMNLLPAQYGPTARQMNSYMNEGGTHRLLSWLTSAGVLEKSKKDRTKYDLSMEKFNKELNALLVDRMNAFGSTQHAAEVEYKRFENQARDAIYRDMDEIQYDKHITLDEFYRRYHIDGEDMSSYTAEERMESWDNLVYESKSEKLLHDKILDKVLDSVHIKQGEKFVEFRSLSNKEQLARRSDIVSDLMGLFATQRAQIRVPVIKYQNGRLVKSEEYQQASRFSEFLQRDLNMPFYIVDNMAVLYESADGRYNRMVFVDIFGENKNLNQKQQEQIAAHRNEFDNLLMERQRLFGEDIKGEKGELGVHTFRLLPNMSPIGIEKQYLKNVEKPFIEFASRWGTSPSIKPRVKDRIEEVRRVFENDDIVATPAQQEYALRLLTLENMLVSGHKGIGGGGRKFLDVLNNAENINLDKALGYSKLYNSKRFVRSNAPFVIDMARAYDSIGDKETHRVFRKFANKKGFGVAIWNDAEFARIKDRIDQWVKDKGIEGWDYEGVIGDAHAEVSEFDSIAFVTEDVMRYGHGTVGHNPNSKNPFKPVISSAGKDSALLYGKTLFVFSPELKGFFSKNPGVDILLTKTGAKLYNESGKVGEIDPTIINAPWESFAGKGAAIKQQDIVRHISLESLGILPAKDAPYATAPRSQSDYNFATNRESGEIYDSEYRRSIDNGIVRMESIIESPIGIREWVLETIGRSSLIDDPTGNMGSAQYSNLVYWAGISRDANPMSHSPYMVKNQLFDMYLNSVMNGMRAVSNQHTEDYQRYGGQSMLIQVPEAGHRLRSTHVNNNGEYIARGEVMLGAHEKERLLSDLMVDGREIRIVRGSEVLSPSQALNDIVAVGPRPMFTTEQGSTYTIEGTRTTRTKVPKTGKGPGLKPQSTVTMYMSPSSAKGAFGQPFGAMEVSGPKKISFGELGVTINGKNFSAQSKPQKGYHPIEFMKGEKGNFSYHVGHKIIDMGMTEAVTKKGEMLWKELVDSGATLETLHSLLEYHVNAGDMSSDTQIGIIVNRKPRTRPNDMTIVGLKGFLDEAYGNSATLGSLDVANVWEGDYDADKIDYFMSSKAGFYDHVERASKFFVQGIDPSRLLVKTEYDFGDNVTIANDGIARMAAASDVYKRSIGVVQKIPRKLGYVEKLAHTNLEDPFVKGLITTDADGNRTAPKILFKMEGSRVLFDYSNLDFFARAAMETQYIIDGTGDLNKDIAGDISQWADRFLFPLKRESVAPGEVRNNKIGFLNDLRSEGHSNKQRIRIFRKMFINEFGEVEEGDLNRAEKAAIKVLLSEYGAMLNSAGKKVWEKSGSKHNLGYDDVYNAADAFMIFNKDINTAVFKAMRNRRVDPKDPDSKAVWKYDKDFRRMFGVVEDEFESKRTGKKVTYKKATKTIFDDTVDARARQFTTGERGAPIDRIVHRIHEADVFGHKGTKGLTGDMIGMMDEWYRGLMSGDDVMSQMAADRLRGEVLRAKLHIGSKVDLIINMKKRYATTKNNDKIPWGARQGILKKMNKDIQKAEKAIQKFLPKEYLKSRSGKDLKKIEFVAIDSPDTIEGAIQYSTMRNIRRILPGINDAPNWGLGSSALDLLKQIKTIRSLFYTNKDSLKDLRKYGNLGLQSSEVRRLLADFPDQSTFYQIEESLLDQGWQLGREKFIYAFMQPTENKYAIGVFEGEPIPVPYGPSSRYSRGLKYLSKVAQSNETSGANYYSEFMQADVNLQRTALGLHQQVEKGQYDYFNRKSGMKDIRYEYKQRMSPGGFELTGEPFEDLSFSQIRLPNFHKDFQRMFSSFREIKWSRDTQRKTLGFELTNDHLLDLYHDIFELAGKRSEFESYMNDMHDLSAKLMENEVMDPMDYIAKRLKMDQDVIRIARDVLTNELLMNDTDNFSVKRIKANPIYALMGGPDYFQGLALERTSKFTPQRLKSLRQMYDNLEAYDHKLHINSEKSRDRLEKIKRCWQ